MRPPMKKQPGRRARRPAREPAANLESVNLEGARFPAALEGRSYPTAKA